MISLTRDQLLDSLRSIQADASGTSDRTLFATQDYFWAVDESQRFDPTTQPTRFTIGQLVDSAEFLSGISPEDLYAGLHLIWVSDLLRGVVDGVVSVVPSPDGIPLGTSFGTLVGLAIDTVERAIPPRILLEDDAIWSIESSDRYDVLRDPEALKVRRIDEYAGEEPSAPRDGSTAVGAVADILELIGNGRFRGQ